MKVLVFAHHGLGDVVMSLPALDRLRQRCDRMIVVVRSTVEEELVREVFQSDGRVECVPLRLRGSGRWGAVRTIVSARAAKCDYTIILHGEATLPARVVALAAGTSLGLPNARRYDVPQTLEDQRHKALRALEVAGEAGRAELLLDELDLVAGVEAIRRRYRSPQAIGAPVRVVFAPGSRGEPFKRWPAEHYSRVIDSLIGGEGDFSVLLLGSREESAAVEQLRASCRNPGAIQPAIVSSLTDTWRALGQSNICVAACSGSLHLAALMGLKVVGLYGPTSSSETGPLGTMTEIVETPCACAPCFARDFRAGCVAPRCMDSIGAERVEDVIRGIARKDTQRTRLLSRDIIRLRRPLC